MVCHFEKLSMNVMEKMCLPNQIFSWEHSGIKVGNVCNLLIIVGIVAGICCVY